MTDANQAVWWERTARFAAIVLAGCAVLVSVPLLLTRWLDGGAFLGLPLGHFMVVLATPVVLAAAIFWFAGRQQTLDRRHDVVED